MNLTNKNMKKYMIRISVLLVIFLVTFASLELFCSKARLLPELKNIKKIDLVSINQDSVKLNIEVEIENKNSFDINVNSYNFNAISEKSIVGNSIKTEPFVLKSSSTTITEALVNLSIPKLFDILSNTKDSIDFILSGSIQGKAIIISFNEDLNIKKTLSINEMLSKFGEEQAKKGKIVQIKDATIEEVGLSKSTVIINMILKNPFGINFKLVDYPAKISINKSYIGEGNLLNIIDVDSANTFSEGKFRCEGSNIGSVLSTLKSLFTGKLEYTADGILELEVFKYRLKLPFKYNGVIIEL